MHKGTLRAQVALNNINMDKGVGIIANDKVARFNGCKEPILVQDGQTGTIDLMLTI